jgi:hypothetical protein
MKGNLVKDFSRVCVKIHARDGHDLGDEAELFVPVFHDWIREKALDLVMLDVADYSHVPEGPGVMLVTHELHFALDRSDGRLGLLAQRRIDFDGTGVEAVADTLRHALRFASLLVADPRVKGRLDFDLSGLRIEANDRLRAPNTAEGYGAFEPLVREAVARVFPGVDLEVSRIENDARDRLSVAVRGEFALDATESVTA